MKKIGLIVKYDDRAMKTADELEQWLQSKNIEVVRKDHEALSPKDGPKENVFAPPDLSCIFVLGGDGTFLSAARWIGDQDIPIIGAKFGEVGFLAETAEEDLFSAAEYILKGDFLITPRMRLLVKIFAQKQEIARETVLNDIVINKQALARLAHINTYINDHYLTTYSADGLIVSTPTGSTAYSLAAGGPIVHPEVAGIVLTPICPFTLTNRPLIVADSVCINIRLAKKSKDVMLTFDGQAGFEINEDHTIIICKSPHPVNMIMMPDQSYFDVLKEKLRWSGGRV